MLINRKNFCCRFCQPNSIPGWSMKIIHYFETEDIERILVTLDDTNVNILTIYHSSHAHISPSRKRVRDTDFINIWFGGKFINAGIAGGHEIEPTHIHSQWHINQMLVL